MSVPINLIYGRDADRTQLVDLMHGQITLDSTLGSGTKATFSIPFNKPQFTNGPTPLIDIGSIPDRLQSEFSVSGCTSDYDHGSSTPPQSPVEMLGVNKHLSHRQHTEHGLSISSAPNSDSEANLLESDRKNIHVLVVEDKYVINICVLCQMLTLVVL